VDRHNLLSNSAEMENGETMTDPIEEFLSGSPPEVQTICQELRAMVKSAMPEAVEVLYARDNHLCKQVYRVDK
jgi:hypothetical protein